MPRRNETTSKAVASKAGRLLRAKSSTKTVKSVAGSALPQKRGKRG